MAPCAPADRYPGDGGGANGASPPDSFKSGTRIKAQVTTTTTTSPDGASLTTSSFAGWFDAMRGEPCSVGIAADTHLRCLPAATPTPYFADPACTQPIVVVPNSGSGCASGPSIPKYAYATNGASCPVQHLQPVGAKLTTVTSYYTKLTPGTCSTLGSFPAAMDAYALDGAEVLPSEFAEMVQNTTTM